MMKVRTVLGLILVLNGFTMSGNVAKAASADDLIFIHHSSGLRWLNWGFDNALLAKSYIDELNDIYYNTIVSPDPGRPNSLAPEPGDYTDFNHWLLWFNDYLQSVKVFDCLTGVNRIIMFKSCFTTTHLTSDGTEPGDPFGTTKTLTNYMAVFRHPAGPGTTYTRNSYTYKPLEDVFAQNTDTLFIFVTFPPEHTTGTTDAEAHRARLFANWVKNQWLPSYNAAHPGLNNVAVFDWFNILAYPDDDPLHPNRLRIEYGGGSGDSHPNGPACTTSTWHFATKPNNFIDSAWNAFLGAGYTLSITAQHGSVTKVPDQTTYSLGTIVTLTAIADSGYFFHSWSGDLTGSDNPATISMTSNRSVTANFVSSPTIACQPVSLSVTLGEGQLSSRTLLVWNSTTTATLSYQVAASPAWLTCLPATGTLSAQATTHTVLINATALNVGNYAGTITITAAGATNSPRLVPVALTVVANAAIGCQPTSLSVTLAEGGMTSRTLLVWNATTTATLFQQVAASPAWLTCQPASGTLTAQPTTHTVLVDATALSAGNYGGTITITAAGATNSPLRIPVGLQVLSAPAIACQPVSLSVTLTEGGMTSRTLLVWNATTTATLFQQVAASPAWLTCLPATGTLTAQPTTHTVFLNATALSAGNYGGTITITAAGAANSPARVPVALQVMPTPAIACQPTSLSVTLAEGAMSSQTLLIWNATTTATLPYQTAALPAWLTCLPASGTLTAQPTTHTVLFDASDLNAGDYAGTIAITAVGAANSPVSVPVGLRVENVTPAVSILVLSPNPAQPPSANVAFQGSLADAAGSITLCQWRSNLDGLLGTSPSLVRSANEMTVGVHTITLTAWDDEGTSASDDTSLTVLNALPTANLVSLSPNPVQEGTTVTVTVAGQDNDEQSQSVVAGELTWSGAVHPGILPGSYQFLAPALGGRYTIEYRVQDDEGEWSAVAIGDLWIVDGSARARHWTLYR